MAGEPEANDLEVVFEESKAFRRDCRRLDGSVVSRVERLVNHVAETGSSRVFKVRVPIRGLRSSLYVGRVDRGKWVLFLTLDDDPVFGERLITLHRLVTHDRARAVGRQLIGSLYVEELGLAVAEDVDMVLEDDGLSGDG